jgi:plastocyanin
MIGCVASLMTMYRSMCVFALLAFALLASPALATQETFDFPVGGRLYSPTQITLGPSDTVCWSPQAVTFSDHPLVFDTADLPDHGTASSADYCPSIAGLRPGFYAFHCSIHGHPTTEGSVGTGMAGSFTIPGDTTASPNFSIVQDGADATFGYTGGADPDLGDSITKYVWDWDGNGSTDATTTATTTQHTYTANGTFHPTLRVIDQGHVLSDPVTHDLTVTGIPDPPAPTPPPGGGGGGTGGGGGPGGTVPVADTTAPVVHLTLAKRLTVATKLRVPFTTDESSSVTATLRVGKRRVKASKEVTVAGRYTLTLKLSKAVRRLLRHRRTVTLTLAVTDDAGNGTTLKRTLKLRAR